MCSEKMSCGYDAVEADQYVVADDLSSGVRAALSQPVEALYLQLRSTGAGFDVASHQLYLLRSRNEERKPGAAGPIAPNLRASPDNDHTGQKEQTIMRAFVLTKYKEPLELRDV